MGKPRPWPYLDVPRPPLLPGFELISIPEAVGIIGAQHNPDRWSTPSTTWRDHYPAEAWFVQVEDEGDGEHRERLGRIKPPVNSEQLDQLQATLIGLLALGLVRAIDEQGEPVPRTAWGTVAAHGVVLLGLDPAARQRACRSSRVAFDDAGEVFVYLVSGDIETTAPEMIAEVARAVKNVGGHPGATWKATLHTDMERLDTSEPPPHRNADGSLRGIRDVVAVLADPPIGLTGRYEGPAEGLDHRTGHAVFQGLVHDRI